MNRSQIFTNKRYNIIFAIICTFLWGSAFPFVKLGNKYMHIEAGDIGSTILFAGARFFMAGIITLTICKIFKLDEFIVSFNKFRSIYFTKKFLKTCIMVSFFMTFFQYTCFYIGLSFASAVNGAIINSSGTIFTVILAFIVYKSERPSITKLLGCLISFIGIIVINFRTIPITDISSLTKLSNISGIGVFSLQGEGLLFLASLCGAVGTIFNKNSTKSYNPITLSGCQLTLGGLILTIIGLISGGKLKPTTIYAFIILIYLSILSATAITLWTVLLKYNKASKISVFKFLTPLFGVLLSGIFLGEDILNPLVGVSLILTCIGIIIMQR